MAGETNRDDIYTQYLLGDLPEEERARLEELYLTDDDEFESLLVARDELLDLHARGELQGQRRERFESHYLSTAPRRRRAREAKELIEFSTAIAAAGGPRRSATGARGRDKRWLTSLPFALGLRSPALRYALAALLLCAALGGAWLLFKRGGHAPPERAGPAPPTETVAQRAPEDENRPRPDEGTADGVTGAPAPPAASPTPRRTQTPEPTPAHPRATTPVTPPPRPEVVASILLTPVLTRGDGRPNTLLVRPDTSTARLRLSFKGGVYRRYVAVLRTVEGEQVWRGAASVARTPGTAAAAVVDVPVRVFRKQDHTATLYGVTGAGETQEIGEYFFRVSKAENQ